MDIKVRNILNYFGRAPFVVAKHFLFSFFLVIFCITFLANLFFYKYYILNQKITPRNDQGQVIIDEKSYNDLLNTWEEQDRKFQDAEEKNYLDLHKAR